ncbi:MAG TPA: hypothetical protein VGT24_13155 [Candidatus Acidoferrales bacterium]|nr:hypothetical protein [Candidatus Acidoferrales bacterium]
MSVVYVVETAEPITERFQDGLQAGIAEVFLKRETAEAAAAEYNKDFPDYPVPAFVVAIPVH